MNVLIFQIETIILPKEINFKYPSPPHLPYFTYFLWLICWTEGPGIENWPWGAITLRSKVLGIRNKHCRHYVWGDICTKFKCWLWVLPTLGRTIKLWYLSHHDAKLGPHISYLFSLDCRWEQKHTRIFSKVGKVTCTKTQLSLFYLWFAKYKYLKIQH